jgi:hypothetical protein
MMRPSRQTVARINRLIAELDGETLLSADAKSATSSYAVIVSTWRRFKRFVDRVDLAVASPFEEGAADVLLGANALIQHEAHRIAFWLVHVGEAIALSSSKRRLDS